MPKTDYMQIMRQARQAVTYEHPNTGSFLVGSDTGNQNDGIPVWGADQDSDSSTESYSGLDAANESTNDAAFGGQRGQDQGIYGSTTSSDSVFNGSGYDSGTVGAGYGVYDTPDPITEYNPIRPTNISVQTTKTRTTLLDKFNKRTSGRSLPQGKNAKAATAVKQLEKVLTLAEVSRFRPIIIDFLYHSTDYIDNAISAITKGHKEVEIWSSLEMVEIEMIVDMFTQMGTKSATAAKAVRTVAAYSTRLQVAVILIPRVYQTIVYTLTNGIDLRSAQ